MNLERIRVTGRDRAKFLHNFCTNNVKSLTVGQSCEAFFTDVKARVLAHGYVLSMSDHHELWIPGNTGESLLQHLNRYIITEDVVLQRLPSTAVDVVHRVPETLAGFSDSEACRRDGGCFWMLVGTDLRFCAAGGTVTGLNVTWAAQPLTILCTSEEEAPRLRSVLDRSGLHRVDPAELNILRVMERFPVVGVDLTSEHMAPEAERNSSAISYAKGCYLGQEPIARLDAMGHVNQALRTLQIRSDAEPENFRGKAIQTASGTTVGLVTSTARTANGELFGLSVIRLNAANQPLEIHESDSGHVASVHVLAKR